MRRVPNPGFAQQGRFRFLFRIGGVIFTAAGVVVLGMWFLSFMRSMTSISSTATKAATDGDLSGLDSAFDSFDSMWMPFAGAVLLSIGLWMLRAGFLGAAARYVAGETMPVVKDAAGFLTDGEGFMGIGRTEEVTPSAGGSFCESCGAHADADARFCRSCGKPVNS